MSALAKRDLAIGVALVALAAIGWFAVIPLGIDLPSNLNIAALSPDFWPRIVMIILAISGAVIAAQAWFSRHRETDASDEAAGVEYSASVRYLRVGLALVCMFVFFVAIDFIGVVLGSTIVIALFSWLLGQRSWLKLALLSVLLPLLLYLFFAHVAHVPMPLGVFESLRG